MAAGITYEPINTVTLGSNQQTLVLSSIPATYTDLRVVIHGTQTSSGTGNVSLRFNSDSGTNYSRTRYLGDGTNGSGERESNVTACAIGDVNTNQFSIVCDIMNYSNTSGNKTYLSRSNQILYVSVYTGTWRSSSAINSITLLFPAGNSFAAGTTMTIYGIKCA